MGRGAAFLALIAVVASTLVLSVSKGERIQAAAEISVADLDRDGRAFLDREIAAHLADIHSLSPPPQRVVGALTTGEYRWGTFMRALAAYAQLSGEGRLAATLTHADWRYTISVRAMGMLPNGRGARGPVPLHLEFEARDLV